MRLDRDGNSVAYVHAWNEAKGTMDPRLVCTYVLRGESLCKINCDLCRLILIAGAGIFIFLGDFGFVSVSTRTNTYIRSRSLIVPFVLI